MPDMNQSTPCLSHATTTESLDVVEASIKARIQQHGDQPHITVAAQLDLLKQLSEFDLGRFLLLNQGLNGYWTHYVLTYPWKKPAYKQKPNELERFILERAPIILATQERFNIFLRENQKAVKKDAVLASIPCGMMGELLYLKLDQPVQLVGIDCDRHALEDAESLLKEKQLLSTTTLLQQDAWALQYSNAFDLISSNGLSIYEPDSQRVTALYETFYRALKPGGRLVTSFVTPSSEWHMKALSSEDLLRQKIVFADILAVKWQCFRTKADTKTLLEAAGFHRIEFFSDRANLFPTVVAYKTAHFI